MSSTTAPRGYVQLRSTSPNKSQPRENRPNDRFLPNMTSLGDPASTNSGTSRARTGTVTVVSHYAPATSMVPTKETKKATEPSAPPDWPAVEANQPPC